MSGALRQMTARKRAAGGGAWSPLNLPNLAAWWDASDASTFTFSSGSVVSQWNDKSGNGYHVTQANASDRPSRSGTQNGLSTVVFDTADALRVTPGTPLFTSAMTIVSVWRQSGLLPTYFRPPFMPDNGVNYGRPLDRWQSGGSNPSWMHETASAMSLDLRSQSLHFVHRLSAQKDGVSFGTHQIIEQKNRLSATTVSNTGAYNTSGQVFGLGARSDGVTSFVGECAEVVLVNAIIGSSDLANLENYLAGKWGISL